MTSPTEISPNQLSRLIGLPDCPVLVDIRIDEDFALDERLVPGSYRRRHTDLQHWIGDCRGKKVVVICHRGQKLSQGIAALLRHEGIVAETLAGGFEAWAASGLLTIDPGKLPPRDPLGRSIWVTRQRPKIDRVACPWLIRRFIDPDSVFLFVAPGEVTAVADRFGGVAFDIEGTFWSHRGDMCTFDTVLSEFGLRSEPLDRMAGIVRGADTARPDLAPEAAGLLSISLGFSRMYRDDLDQLAASLGVYDALYRWSRDATGESHDWPQPGGGV